MLSVVSNCIDKQGWEYLLHLFQQHLQLLSINFDINGIRTMTMSSLSILLRVLFNSYLELFGQCTTLKIDEQVMRIMEENLPEIEALCTVFTLNYLLERKQFDASSVLQKLQLDSNAQKMKFLLKQRISNISSVNNLKLIPEDANNCGRLQIYLQLTVPVCNRTDSTLCLGYKNNENSNNYRDNDDVPLLKKRCLPVHINPSSNVAVDEQKMIVKILQEMEGLSKRLLSFSNRNIRLDNNVRSRIQTIQNNLSNCITK